MALLLIILDLCALNDDSGLSAGAGLTASYDSGQYESETVSTDASVYALNVSGGLPGSQADGSVLIKVQTWINRALRTNLDRGFVICPAIHCTAESSAAFHQW